MIDEVWIQLKPSRETKTGSKNRRAREIDSKNVVFDLGREMTFGSSYFKFRKIEGLRNWESSVECVLYSILVGSEKRLTCKICPLPLVFSNARAMTKLLYLCVYSYRQLTLSDQSFKPTRQDRMVVWLFTRICIYLQMKSTSFYFCAWGLNVAGVNVCALRSHFP